MSQNSRIVRVPINSRFGVLVSDSNILQIISIVRKVLYSKTPLFSGRQHFYPIFKILVRTLQLVQETDW